MITKIAARVRGLFNAGNYPENREDEQFHINPRGDQCVAQGLPELTETVRMGNSWMVKTTTGLAAATALPTTTSGLTIYNAEPSTGKCYVIDSAAYWEGIVDATQSDQTILIAQLSRGTIVVPGTLDSLTPVSLSGRTNYDGRAVFTTNRAMTTDQGWYPCGTNAPAGVTAVAGSIWKMQDVQLRGLYIVPPLGQFSLATIKPVAAASQVFYCIRWHEVQLPWRS